MKHVLVRVAAPIRRPRDDAQDAVVRELENRSRVLGGAANDDAAPVRTDLRCGGHPILQLNGSLTRARRRREN